MRKTLKNIREARAVSPTVKTTVPHKSLVESVEDLDEAIESGNKGYGYHGQFEDNADSEYSKMHRRVKRVTGEAGHLADVKKPNVMVKHYLDSKHGRHLADYQSGKQHGEVDKYISKDFSKFKKSYNPELYESMKDTSQMKLTDLKESRIVKGKSYGATYDAGEDDKKTTTTGEKRGRGRPAKETQPFSSAGASSKSLQDILVGKVKKNLSTKGRVFKMKEDIAALEEMSMDAKEYGSKKAGNRVAGAILKKVLAKKNRNESVELDEREHVGYYAAGTVNTHQMKKGETPRETQEWKVKYADFPGKNDIAKQNPHLKDHEVEAIHGHISDHADDDFTGTSSEQHASGKNHDVYVRSNKSVFRESNELDEASKKHPDDVKSAWSTGKIAYAQTHGGQIYRLNHKALMGKIPEVGDRILPKQHTIIKEDIATLEEMSMGVKKNASGKKVEWTNHPGLGHSVTVDGDPVHKGFVDHKTAASLYAKHSAA